MTTPIIWKKLIIEKQKITTSGRIKELAAKLDKDGVRSLRYLQEHGYIVRILRGYYYVKSPEERQLGKLDYSLFEIVAMALREKGVNDWYFGLETGLKLNNMTHEYYSINYVITSSYETTKVISILDTKFKFLKWNKKHFKFGIEKKGVLRYSDKEKTVLDMVYRTYRNKIKEHQIFNLVREHSPLLDNDKLKKYYTHYPMRFQQFGELI